MVSSPRLTLAPSPSTKHFVKAAPGESARHTLSTAYFMAVVALLSCNPLMGRLTVMIGDEWWTVTALLESLASDVGRSRACTNTCKHVDELLLPARA